MADEVEYKQELGWAEGRGFASVRVRFTPAHGGGVERYAVVLVCGPPDQQVAVRVFDNAHGHHDDHRCDLQGNRKPPHAFHQGTAEEAMHEALRLIERSYVTMIELWAAQQDK